MKEKERDVYIKYKDRHTSYTYILHNTRTDTPVTHTSYTIQGKGTIQDKKTKETYIKH